jgi:molybdenum cofactor synthesis domain-containing protein
VSPPSDPTSPNESTRQPAELGPTAAIVIIGEEILSGKVEEENARFLVQELRGLGVAVRRIEVLPDIVEEIALSVRTLSARHDHVFTSGGVGPTHDDVTLPAVAAAFGMGVTRRPELAELIRRSMGPDMHDRELRMADIPEGAQLLYGDPPDPTRWPVVAVHNVYILPGVPTIFRRKFDSLRGLLKAGPIFSRTLFSREGEGPIAAALDTVVGEFPAVAIGSYPRIDAADHKVKITLDGRDAAAVDRALERLVDLLGAAVVRTG